MYIGNDIKYQDSFEKLFSSIKQSRELFNSNAVQIYISEPYSLSKFKRLDLTNEQFKEALSTFGAVKSCSVKEVNYQDEKYKYGIAEFED